MKNPKIINYSVLSKTFLLFFCLSSFMVSAREVKYFNDGWQFKKGPFAASASYLKQDITGGEWKDVQIPHTWNNKDMQDAMVNMTSFRNPQQRFYTGEGLYKKIYTPEESLKGKRIFLKFEGVGTVAEVYVNNQFAGRHKGGYSAFTVEISRLLKYGNTNEIIVKADNAARPDVIPVNHVLFAVYGGIYRDIQIITTDKINFSVTDYASPGVYIKQSNVDKRAADVSVKVKIDNKEGVKKDIKIENSIYDMSGKLVVHKALPVTLSPQGEQIYTQEMKVKNPHLWQGVDDPYLYKVVSKITSGGKVIDEVIQPLGLRHFEFKIGEGMILNGKKYPMYGVCRHQDWLGKGSALTKAEHDADINIIKELGATTIRLAHYQQAEYFYSKCDSVGLLVWAEIPFVNAVTTFETENSIQQLTELIRQNFNHPSIFTWGLHNEVYSPFEQTIPLTNRLNDLSKSEDPDRYTVSVSGYNIVMKQANHNADIQGINQYFGWYNGKISDIENWLSKVEKQYPDHKIIFSEYGGEANINQQKELVTESGDCCGFSHKYYETWGTKFHEIHWGALSKSKYILATYIWNTFDFATPLSSQGGVHSRNMKGLVTFDRKTKKDPFYWYKANWSKEPVLYLTQRRAVERENDVTQIAVYSNIGKPIVSVNGKILTNYRIGNTNVHYIFEDVQLKEGENIITAEATKQGKKYEDQIKWVYSSEFKKETDSNTPQERKDDHIGL